MRCVSYTRTTSCKEDGKIPADIIKQQDQHIQEYLKKQGWTLSAKYCDRKKDTEEDTVFEELTKDGINRKFDMVVVDSIDRCGRTGVRLYTSSFNFAQPCVFVKQLPGPILCASP